MKRLVIGMSGSSGVIYGIRMLEALAQDPEVETHLILSQAAKMNIGINCITPAAAKTRIFDQMSQEHIDYMLSKIPRERFLQVEEVADMVNWLCSSGNSFTTGAVFDLSGGRATY